MKTRQMTQGQWLTVVGVVAAILMGVPQGVTAQDLRFDGTTLRVATYGGTYKDAIHDLIGKELERRGAKIEYVIADPRTNLAKLIAARGSDVPFDVMELDEAVKADMLELNLLEELNFANLPNTENLIDPTYRDRHSVVIWQSQEGIIYNVKKFQELGIPKPEFKDLFNPKLAGRVALPDITYPEALTLIVALAIEKGGNESNIDPGLALIRDLKVAYFYKGLSELSTRFASGDVWAAWHHAGGAIRIRRAGVPVGISFPKVGKDKRGATLPGLIGILKGGKARRAAEFFIDRYFDPEVMATIDRRIGLGPVKAAALPKILNDPEVNDLLLLTAADIRNLYHVDWPKVKYKDWVDKWNRTVTR